MHTPPVHHLIAADVHRVPAPFDGFAVRSDEPQHATLARCPYGRVHLVHTDFLDADTRAGLVAQGYAGVRLQTFGDVDHATPTLQALAAAAPGVPDLVGAIAGALQLTGVLGPELQAYRRSVEAHVHYLGSCGSGFHNDVAGPWSRSLFWLLALDAHDVAFVMPHAGVSLPLAPGDLIVFDQTLAHGLCRPRDQGRAVAASFESVEHRCQLFLTGELHLSDLQWAVLGAPWLPVDAPERRGALDLLVAAFDDRSGTIQQLHALRGGMLRSTCHADSSAEAG